MKTFRRQDYSSRDCSVQLLLLESLLQQNDTLDERNDILPFFRKHKDLALGIGEILGVNANLIAFEYDLFGDFVCDLAIGDSRTHSYLLVEFEDAKRDSLFIKRKNRATPDWAPRLEQGFSQVVDWLWKLNDTEKSDDYTHRFGVPRAEINCMIVIGRDQHLEERERRRLYWRKTHTIVNSRKIAIVTYDQLLRDLRYRVERQPEATAN